MKKSVDNPVIMCYTLITVREEPAEEMEDEVMKFLKKESKKEKGYKIAFCDTPDLSTKFGEWNGTFDTYSSADHCIRMGWGKAIKAKATDAYEIDSAWLVIEKIS